MKLQLWPWPGTCCVLKGASKQTLRHVLDSVTKEFMSLNVASPAEFKAPRVLEMPCLYYNSPLMRFHL